MTYTIKNLRETEDQAVEFGVGEIQEAHFPAAELDAQSIGLGFHVLHPGKRQGFAHRHEHAEEIYVVLAGTGSVKLDEDIVELKPLDAIRVAPAVTRAFEAGPDGMELIVFGPRHDGDGEVVGDDFWAD